MLSLALMFVMLAGIANAGERQARPNSEASDTFSPAVNVEIVAQRPADESEIDDIPFNTIKIAEQAGYDLRGMLPAEEEISDIPFNTAEIARKHRKLR